MRETYYGGIYWAERKEPAEACAQRAETFFRLLSRCDPIYARWFEQADSRKKALQLQFEPTAETFTRFFKRRAYQEGRDGFMIGVWTGHEQGHGGQVSLRCGSAAEFVPNSGLLYLPKEEPEMERVLTATVLAEVLRTMVLAWEPDWGVITSGDFRDSLSEQGLTGTFVGWLTYVSRNRGEVPPLPEPVRVQPVEDKGTLIILTPERLTASNSEHVSLGRRVQDVLRAKGLLEPVVSRRPTT
ncbi:immunity 52 family protein [Archangium lansingense]|uniref:Immunity 52 family protein n=1 Tax=Archangium lansingense TaxID=2995310 RepID=A0ABT4AJ12_9BACT|nr:immunity 52 family protein [Archangium lansinium]MCY1081692.1 immunity 52 family protein [Archangium lansinium]